MMAYASRTGTKKNLEILRDTGWGLLVSAKGKLNPGGLEGFKICLDNGAWHSYQQGKPFDEDAFERALDLFGERAEFVVAPDIVCGGLESLDYSVSWLERLDGARRVLIPVQDGMEREDIEGLLSDGVGIFVGGSDEWKDATIPYWGAVAMDCGCYVHVGRVNTKRRLHKCATSGVDSFDGSGPSRWYKAAMKMNRWRSQGSMVLL